MMRITSDQVTPAIRSLFRTDDMVASRCFVVLDRVVSAGKIMVDNRVDPKWGIVQEAVDNAIFLGGSIDAPAFAEVFAALRQEGDVLVGLLPGDPRIQYLPPDPMYDGRTLEFYDRPMGIGLDTYLRQVPADCRIERLDRNLILRTEWGPNDVKFYGGVEMWAKICFGYGLMRGDEILSEATVGPPGLGLYEPGVFTQEAHRGKGYGTMVVARLIQEIEAMGGQTYWNCAKHNLPSVAIGRKLGYRIEKEYRCMIWSKTDSRG
jgi:GNAT superfamily N-acetyltransferase